MFDKKTSVQVSHGIAITASPRAAETENTNLYFPIVMDPRVLAMNLSCQNLMIVSVSTVYLYAQGHIPGAVFLDYYGQLEPCHPPLSGVMADTETFSRLLSRLGAKPDTHLVVYDDETGGKAGRFCWALDSMGHHRWSLLDGGRLAWVQEGYPLDRTEVTQAPTNYKASFHKNTMVSKEYILSRLGSTDTILLDTRTCGEFSGEDYLTDKAGHIPGAINVDWMLTMDPISCFRLKSRNHLIRLLNESGVTMDKEIITYCHAHQRAAHTYVVLKFLGYTKIRGYCGAWVEWGNASDTPVETSQCFAAQ